MATPFDAATDVTPAGPGRYQAVLDPAWNLAPLPQGGILTAVAVKAMERELDRPEQTLRTLHTAFVAQVADGPVTVRVELLRSGRSMSHLRAEVVNEGALRGHLTTAVFGTPRKGFDFTDLRPPEEIRPPAECPSWREPMPEGAERFLNPMRFWNELVEGRTLLGHAPWEPYEPDRAERALWYRMDEPPLRSDGTLDPGALVVLADTMPGAVNERLGPQPDPWFAPSVDLTVHLLDECRSPWVLAHNRARFAGGGYASADMALWDCGPEGADGPRLVAYATQLFLFTFPS